MNRKEILKEINYQGEYNKTVKKKLRELLKKYHPDHYKKETDTFKLISEIKKELDNNKHISYEEETDTNKKDTNDYKITEEIMELTSKLDKINHSKINCQKELNKLQEDYRKEYNCDINNRNKEYDNNNTILLVQSKKQKYSIWLIICITISVICIFTKLYYPFIITIILLIFVVYNYAVIEIDLNKYIKMNSKTINSSKESIKRINSINKEISDLYKKIWDLDCEKNRITTRINLLKAKIR